MVARAKIDQLPVLFLWHHHQPFYQAPGEQRPKLPWVRLHAVRGYSDMLQAAQTTGSRMTFNFSSSLLEQLIFAAQESPADEFERISLIPARDLSEDQRRFILIHFFSINWSVHVKSNPRYSSLLAKRGENLNEQSIKSVLTDYTLQDYTDLIALFNSFVDWLCKEETP